MNPQQRGTKAAAHYQEDPGGTKHRAALPAVRGERMRAGAISTRSSRSACAEADLFLRHDRKGRNGRAPDARQAAAGLLWSKQFYYYERDEWLRAIRRSPPPAAAVEGRNSDWEHSTTATSSRCRTRGSIPWYASWDLGVPHRGFCGDRSVFRQRATYSAAAGMVHASERADSGLRICVRRRESAGACVGGVACYKIGAARGSAIVRFSSAFFKSC